MRQFYQKKTQGEKRVKINGERPRVLHEISFTVSNTFVYVTAHKLTQKFVSGSEHPPFDPFHPLILREERKTQIKWQLPRATCRSNLRGYFLFIS